MLTHSPPPFRDSDRGNDRKGRFLGKDVGVCLLNNNV